jgi:hypothetical protein
MFQTRTPQTERERYCTGEGMRIGAAKGRLSLCACYVWRGAAAFGAFRRVAGPGRDAGRRISCGGAGFFG